MVDWTWSVRNKGRLLAAGTAVAGLATGGCGSSGSTGPLAGLSGKQVLTSAVANLKAAPSFTVAGTVANAGTAITVTLGFRPGEGCTGTVSESGKGSLAMVVIGTTAWAKPDDAYWKAVAGKQAEQAIATFGGKYIKGPTSDKAIAGLTEFCDLNWVTGQLTQPSRVTKGTVTTVMGQRALPLTETANGGTLYVTETAAPLPIKLASNTGGKKGTLVFDVGATVSLTAPSASETVDGAKYGL